MLALYEETVLKIKNEELDKQRFYRERNNLSYRQRNGSFTHGKYRLTGVLHQSSLDLQENILTTPLESNIW